MEQNLTNLPVMKTKCQEERDARDLALLNDYDIMVSEGHSKTRINEVLMKKYDLHSTGTIYVILKRVRERIGKEAAAV